MGPRESTGYERSSPEVRFQLTAGFLDALSRVIAIFVQLVLLAVMRTRTLAVAAVVFGLALAPLPVGSMHAELLPVIVETADGYASDVQFDLTHGHSHDDDPVGHSSDSHTPAHDAADHSHQFASLLPVGGHQTCVLRSCWPSMQTRLPDPAHSHGLERPPRLPLSI